MKRHFSAVLGAFLSVAVLYATQGASATAASGQGAAAAANDDPTVDLAASQLAADWGVSLADARVRILRQPDQNAFLTSLQSMDPDHFGGSWVDQAHGGVLVVNMTDNDNEVSSLALKNPNIGQVRVDRALANYSSLLATASRITAQQGGPDTVSASVNPRNGGSVDVARLTHPGVDLNPSTSLAGLPNQYGAYVKILPDTPAPIEASCSIASCDPPLRGGIEGHWSLTKPGICTLGFMAANIYGWYAITAGHCVSQSYALSSPESWYVKFATTDVYHAVGVNLGSPLILSSMDAGVIPIDNPTGWQMPNYAVYVAASSGSAGHPATTLNPNYFITGVASPMAGATYVCHTGAGLQGTACGLVNSYNSTTHAYDVTMQTCEGDSGGPVYIAGSGYGVVVSLTGSINNAPCGTHAQYVDLQQILTGFGAGLTVHY